MLEAGAPVPVPPLSACASVIPLEGGVWGAVLVFEQAAPDRTMTTAATTPTKRKLTDVCFISPPIREKKRSRVSFLSEFRLSAPAFLASTKFSGGITRYSEHNAS